MKRCVHAVKLAMTVMLSAFLFLSVQDLGFIHAADKKIVLLKQASKENYDTISCDRCCCCRRRRYNTNSCRDL